MRSIATIAAVVCVLLSISAFVLIPHARSVHAQSANWFSPTSVPGGGVYIAGPKGSITFCADAYLFSPTQRADAKCGTLSGEKLTPVSDKWNPISFPTSNDIFYLDSSTGKVIQCMASVSVSSSGTPGPVMGACKLIATAEP
jgi:hypothetical protein